MWTFGKRIAAGFALSFLLLLVIGTVGYRAVGSLSNTSHLVSHTHLVLGRLSHLLSLLQDTETGQRGFVITGSESFLEPFNAALPKIDKTMGQLRELTADNRIQQARLDQMAPVIREKLTELRETIDLRRTAGFEPAARAVSQGRGKRAMDRIRNIREDMVREEETLLTRRAEDVEAASNGARITMVTGTLVCLLLALVVGWVITSGLTRRIGSAVQHVQSSSAELQAAANQQVASAQEQAMAMREITTTISELLATSRQIAESAQRVSSIANDTVSAARVGDDTVVRTQNSVSGIKRQVDIIVGHMTELGTKSQQIGSILEFINQLAEQANILAINAAIEAASAGEMGQRFAVVADEIRKLADRVGGSTKDIRGLVDDVRAAVDTTVMATDGGSQAVDSGTRQFEDVARSFRQIAGLVITTTEAAREIELSTRQQASAVEQVNLVIASISQAARETEVSSTQTLQTSAELTGLSRELARLIQPQTNA